MTGPNLLGLDNPWGHTSTAGAQPCGNRQSFDRALKIRSRPFLLVLEKAAVLEKVDGENEAREHAHLHDRGTQRRLSPAFEYLQPLPYQAKDGTPEADSRVGGEI